MACAACSSASTAAMPRPRCRPSASGRTSTRAARGRTGLLAQAYDEQAWIRRGEERLPAAVRRLGPTPKIAAAWLSLRELFGGSAADRSRAALRLRGTWDDPIVTPAE